MAKIIMGAVDPAHSGTVREKLISKGIEPSRIRLLSTPPPDDPGLAGVIERMFSGLTLDAAETREYACALTEGRHLVTVVADDNAAPTASDVLASHGATAPRPESEAVHESDAMASVSGPRVYPLPDSPTGWKEAMLGEKSTIGEAADRGRPAGVTTGAAGLGTDRDRARLGKGGSED